MNVMKKIINTAIALALVFTALPGNAGVDPTLRNLKGKTTVLTVSGVEKGDIIYIKDLFGHVLYQKSITDSGRFQSKYDLTGLEEGSYYFEVIAEDQLRRLPFRVVNHKVVIKKRSEWTINQQAESSSKKMLKLEKRSANKSAFTPMESRTPTFKGQDFANYHQKN